MNGKMPVGIQLARAVNLIAIVLSIIVGILMAMIAVPNFIKAAQNVGKQANPILLIIVGLISFAIVYKYYLKIVGFPHKQNN